MRHRTWKGQGGGGGGDRRDDPLETTAPYMIVRKRKRRVPDGCVACPSHEKQILDEGRRFLEEGWGDGLDVWRLLYAIFDGAFACLTV